MEKEEKQINVNIEKYDGNKPIRIVLRQGEAVREAALLRGSDYEALEIEGQIETPGNYLEKRLGMYRQNDSLLYVNRNDNAIRLELNASDAYPSVKEDEPWPYNPCVQKITGHMSLDDMYKKLHINDEEHYWAPQKLASVLRLNAHIFVSELSGAKLVSALKNVRGRIEGEYIKQKDSGEGAMNRQEFYQESISHNLPGSIEISIPLVKGDKAQTYTVELDCDYVDGNIRVQLVSPSINAEWEKQRDQKIDAEVQRILELDDRIAVIEE